MDGSPVSLTQQCLETLPAARLRELVDALGAHAADRRSKPALISTLVGAETQLPDLLANLTLVELRRVLAALGIEKRARAKNELIEAIVSYAPETQRTPRPTSSSPPPMSVRSEGLLKSSLRRFVIDAAGGYRGQDASVTFATQLLKAFGWATGHPPNAEIPATLSIAEHGQRTTRDVTMVWNERRVLLEVTKPDVMLDFAWKDLLRACLQIDPVPQYVVLTNQRDLHLYDVARDREKPRLSIAIDDLPKSSEAFPFFTDRWVPGTTPTIINTGKVSREVADLVAKVYRSLKEKHPRREQDVAKFTLQCIIAMFAEDIGLLPQEYFTSLLHEGARHRDVEKRLADLFQLMSEPDAPGARAVPFFNGGLFSDPVSLRLDDAQLQALTKAAAADWKYVDPHIFGSVFQGIMDDAERHAAGAHYTAQDDIMRVVGPTIVDPWRARVRAATTLTELLELRAALFEFRVLDPACGSGNFLYVAFRELYRLDTEILIRIREYKSTEARTKPGGVRATNFFGFDTNRFAVELARVTLNIAKKIAYEERKETLSVLSAQGELEIDPSLPLDNLDANIRHADSLFADWPKVDAIVSNPPFLGGLKIRSELGEPYLRRLQEGFPGVNGRTDICAYWFRRAHDHLDLGARAGLIGTNSIRDGNTREATTDYIVANGGTITNAVSSREWPGEAAVSVSMVNWVKGPHAGPRTLLIDGHVYEPLTIPPHLQLHSDLSGAKLLKANSSGTSQGMIMGSKLFELSATDAMRLRADRSTAPFLRAVADATRLFTGRLEVNPNFTLDLSSCETEAAAKKAEKGFEFLKANVLPYVRSKGSTYDGWIERWWQPWRPRGEFFRKVGATKRLVACSSHAARPVFFFLSRRFFPTHSLQLFAFDDDYSFGILQSKIHWGWAVAQGSKIEERTRYTMEVWAHSRGRKARAPRRYHVSPPPRASYGEFERNS